MSHSSSLLEDGKIHSSIQVIKTFSNSNHFEECNVINKTAFSQASIESASATSATSSRNFQSASSHK
jgi:hypothetical protein